MSDRLEDRIRDYLASHLDLLESGLSLIQTEYVLDNPLGAAGKIDIVARDEFNHVVITEIKRSDQSARQALHEMHKYTALFRGQQGLDEHKMRVFIVSTHWHGLLVPLAECAETFLCPVSAFQIDAQPDGTVVKAQPMTLPPKSKSVEFSRSHAIFLFESAAEADKGIPTLLEALKNCGVEDFMVIQLDYGGSETRVIFPAALYVVISSPLPNMSQSDAKALKDRLNWDESLDEPDENFQVAITEVMSGVAKDTEIGYPEKLVTILNNWSVKALMRAGRLEQGRCILNDEELLRQAAAVEGGNFVNIIKFTSPRFASEWKKLLFDLKMAVQGMPKWRAAAKLLLKEIAAQTPSAKVSVEAYSPGNLILTLYAIATKKDFSKCPVLQITVLDSQSKSLRVIGSQLAWDGRSLSMPPEDVFNQVYGGFDQWCAFNHFGETPTKEPAALKIHGLTAPIVEIVFHEGTPAPPEPRLLILKKDTLLKEPLEQGAYRSVEEFAEQNKDYLSKFQKFMDAHGVVSI